MATRVALLLIALVLLVSVRSGSAGAHANLERSEPEANAVLAQSPFEIKLYFSEEPDLGSSRIEVLDTAGNRFDNDDLHAHDTPTVLSVTVPALPDGTYTVAWRNVSTVDGHPRAGTFAFSVGEASPGGDFDADQFAFDAGGPPRWLSAMVRWLGYISFFSLLGIAAFPRLILRPSLRRAGVQVEDSRAWHLAVIITLAALTAGSILALLMQAWTSGGDAASIVTSELKAVATSTRFGAIWWARASLTLIAMGAGIAVLRLRESPQRVVAEALLVFSAVFLPLTIALNGHGAADRDYAKIATGVDWLHIVAGGLWIGGLMQLALVVPATIAPLDVGGRLRVLGAAIPRFSTLAIACVATVVFTGVNQWFIILGNIDDTLHSQYGVTLVVKVAFVLPLLSLGALNLLVMRARIAGQLREQEPGNADRLATTFRRAVAAEVMFGVTVLAVTGVLTTGSPPFAKDTARSNFEGALIQTLDAGEGVDITLSVDPGAAGQNELNFILDGIADDEPIETFLVRFTYLDDDLGTTEDEATAIHPTHFQLSGSQLSLAGQWEMEAIARRDAFEDIITTFIVDVAAPPTASAPAPTLAPLPTFAGPHVAVSASNSRAFDQTSVEAPAGSVSVVFTNNEAGVPHNVHVYAGTDAEQRDVGETRLERGPDRQVLTLQLPAGTYRYVCDVHPVMEGTLILQ